MMRFRVDMRLSRLGRSGVLKFILTFLQHVLRSSYASPFQLRRRRLSVVGLVCEWSTWMPAAVAASESGERPLVEEYAKPNVNPDPTQSFARTLWWRRSPFPIIVPCFR